MIFFFRRIFSGEQATLPGSINSFIHVIMYFYYFLAALGPQMQPYLWWKKYLTRMQMVSMREVHSILLMHLFQYALSTWFTDSIRDHPYLVHWPSLVRLSVPESVHLLHVRERGPLPIFILVVLQKDVHQDAENGENQLNTKTWIMSILW